MGFRAALRNIGYFFRYLHDTIADFFATWFLPYHSDEEEEEKAPSETETTAQEPSKAQSATEPAGHEARAETAVATVRPLTEIMAFRGPMSTSALAAATGESIEHIEGELGKLAESHIVEDLGGGRYVLADSERRHILRSDAEVSDWLSRLEHSQLESDVLEIIETICRQFPVKIASGKNLVFHLRQRKWMVWEARGETCRVRIFGTADGRQLRQIRQIDRRLRLFRRKEPHRWDNRDWVAFRWNLGSDLMAIEAVVLESGRQFERHARRRRRGKRRRSTSPRAETDSATSD